MWKIRLYDPDGRIWKINTSVSDIQAAKDFALSYAEELDSRGYYISAVEGVKDNETHFMIDTTH